MARSMLISVLEASARARLPPREDPGGTAWLAVNAAGHESRRQCAPAPGARGCLCDRSTARLAPQARRPPKPNADSWHRRVHQTARSARLAPRALLCLSERRAETAVAQTRKSPSSVPRAKSADDPALRPNIRRARQVL